ncbi:hypothetical protein CRI94_15230 [Longibacter salinarum]|uniref:Uncharacterized protein n=1 Tax=Longibacter salinarum TaxID=1850348 RepID=A0A2A8CUB7_9BACT|nr:hypothetical protein [Longibacter salinarum]PEN11389.1 hypothetical protein CRI94_15230 [Longibacter salinarum]
MSETASDPFALSDEELLEEIEQLDRRGANTETIVETLEIRYGRHRVGRHQLVSAIQRLIHREN